jgi:hypothetical protein
MPKLEAGPPVLVRLVDPEPRPGFILTDTSPPGATRPNSSSWWSEQALKRIPRRRCSASRREGIWEVSWTRSGVNPARSARSTSKSLDASTCSPRSRKSARMPWLGLAFIA